LLLKNSERVGEKAKMSNFLLPFLSVLFLGSLSLTHSGRAPRGWNSWDSLPNYPTEATVLDAARYVRDYLLPSGYDTITVDEGWFSGGDPTSVDAFGRPYPNVTAFPGATDGRGLRYLADIIHSYGLKFGAWNIRGIPIVAYQKNLPIWNSTFTAQDATDLSFSRACPWCSWTLGTNAPSAAATAHYRAVAAWWSDQGLDFIKMDCMWPNPGQHLDQNNDEIAAFAQAMVDVAPHIVISWSPGDGTSVTNGTYVARHGGQYGVMYRITGDLHDTGGFQAILAHLKIAQNYTFLVGAEGTYPDLDMLPLGMQRDQGSTRPLTPCRYTETEQTTIMSLWAIMRAPLIVGAALPLLPNDTFTLSLLTHPDILNVNSNSINLRVVLPVWNSPNLFAWMADMADDVVALVLAVFNGNDGTASSTVTVPLPPFLLWCATDVWSSKVVPGTFQGYFSVGIVPHGSGVYRLAPCE